MTEATEKKHGVAPDAPSPGGDVWCICGRDMEWVDCFECHGEGGEDGEALMELDPLWYQPDDWRTCGSCYGKGGWWMCMREFAPPRRQSRERAKIYDGRPGP